MERINGAARQGLIFSKQVRQNLIVTPAVVRKNCNDGGHVLRNNALGVEECLRNEALPFGVAPHDELACIEQVKDASDGEIKLLSNFFECQQLLPGEELR